MIFIIDTNILLVSVSPQSSKHWVYKAFLQKKIQLAVSTEILLEYEEILTQFMGNAVAETVTSAIANAKNTNLITKWYNWHLITVDPDDNKFVDAAIAAGADYIVTEDGHFDVLKNIPFPPVKVISLKDFKQLLESL